MSGPSEFAALHERVEEAMGRQHVPGVAVGVLHDEDEHVAGFGVNNVDHPLPVTPDTIFQIGSISKTVTATVLMQLVEQGQLALDEPVRTYLPELRLADQNVAGRVTLRHLLTHVGGWAGDYFTDTGAGDDALARAVAELVQVPQLTPLGEVYAYNNAGFYVAGRLIEVLTGQTYEAAVRDMIFRPLGMEMSFFFASEVITYRVAAGHLVEEEVAKVTRPWGLTRAAHPVGGVLSTVRDQLRYARFQMGDGTAPDGTRLLLPESLVAMQQPLVRADAGGGYVGLPWRVRPVGRLRTVSHGGVTRGQMATLQLVPERQFAMVVLTNSNRGGVLHGELVKWALGHYLDAFEGETAHREMPPEQLAAYAGRYTGLLSDVNLAVRDGALVLETVSKGGFPTKDTPPAPAPPPTRLAFRGDDWVVALDPPLKDGEGDFLRRPDGSIAWFRWGGRILALEGR